MSQIEKIEKLPKFAQESVSWLLEADFEAQVPSRSRPFGPAPGKHLGFKIRLQTPGDRFLSEILQFLDFLNLAHFHSSPSPTLRTLQIFKYPIDCHETLGKLR